ncbi:hypothetical protein B7P43_G16287 [Cryptotermes secundus]|nr:hypothetical protein B7P43_G16287 [Cryptotermes secundus]
MRLLDRIVDGNTLNERLFALLVAAPLPVQQEIIFCLPDIIGDEQHHEAALQLSKLLRTNFRLTAVVMEALDNLSLENTLRAEVCKLMLIFLNKAPPEFLPAIVGFLISSDEPFENLVEVVSGLRKKLDLNLADGLDGNIQVLTLSALHSRALSSQRLADIWLKAVSGAHSPSELYPLDIVVLLLLHSFIPGLKKQVQNILRSHIKGGVVTEALIEKTFTIYLAAMKEYLKSALEIATTLFKSPDPPVSYLGSVWFKLMLVHLEHYQSQSIILELLLLIGTCNVNIARSALEVLAGVDSRHLLQHTLLLMGLLDNLQDMDLIQVEHVMDLLCNLVYGGGGVDSLHEDEIHMMIRKYLSSSSDMLKQKGVVGAVMALKHMATSEIDSQENIQSSSSTDDSHLSERASRAKGLLELVMESVKSSVACVGLLYDQLAAMVCRCDALDISFLKWIAEEIADRFQDYFVKELKEVSKMGYTQFSLEASEEDYEDAICVNIEGVLRNEKSQGNIGAVAAQSLCVMAPMFRLLRSLQFRISNNLDSVDGLLSCSVAMPKDMTDLIDDFPKLNHDEQIFILDSLFYCINWFRELVNAFSLLRDEEMQTKVLQRIENIISLQQLLAKGLGYAKSLDYRPPRCHFYVDVKPLLQEKLKKPANEKRAGKGKGKGKQKGKTKDAGNTSITDVNAVVPGNPSSNVTGEMDLSVYKDFFRELDIEVFVALSSCLVLDERAVKEDKLVLYPTGLLFLLEDYVTKLDHCLPSTLKLISSLATTQQAASVGYASLDRIPTPLIARRAMKLLTFILMKLEATAEYCQKLLDSNDGIYDGPEMFKDGSAEVKLCYSMLLHSVASTLGWIGFHSSAYNALLRDCLHIIASRQNSETTKTALLKELVLFSCQYFLRYASCTVLLTSAGNLVRVMQVLSTFAPNEAEPRQKIAEVCHGFLSRQWYTLNGLPEHGAVYNRQIESLLKSYFANVTDTLSVVNTTAKWVEDEIQMLQNKDSCLHTFPTINKTNFPVLYRNLWYALETATDKALDSSADKGSKFKVWHLVCSTMSVLTNVIRQHAHRTNYQAYIKQSQAIIKLFLSDGMPVLEALLKSMSEDVIGLLKILQVTTRYLHTLCISTKREKMAGLTIYVPIVRKTLETLIFRVKGMLVANNSPDAFWMGNLKNKTIRGDEIMSQDSAADEQNSDDGDEEDLPQDENSDIDLDSHEDKHSGEHDGSISDVF